MLYHTIHKQQNISKTETLEYVLSVEEKNLNLAKIYVECYFDKEQLSGYSTHAKIRNRKIKYYENAKY